ncbi:hypothetical protein [Streptomyces sp. NPDC093261]|uniref:hypothetical protein n=1 Tax=Streptomyces sp. NPDC093261 TaxID=3366037 RepID=UPI0038244D75
MKYPIKAWRSTSAERVEMDLERRPTCPGNPKTGAGCGRKPDHVLTWTTNKSGLPGQGAGHMQLACLHHIHSLLAHSEEAAMNHHVEVTRYEGV